MKNIRFVFLIAFAVNAACSSSVKKIDTTLDQKGVAANGAIGIKDDKVIIQSQTAADNELRAQQWQNVQYENDLNSAYFSLKRCREDLADPRLGGNGTVIPLPEIDNMKQPATVREEFGLDEKNGLIFQRTEDFLARIELERKYETTLKGMIKIVNNQDEECSRKMGVARLRAGLPAKRFQGKITVTPDGRRDKTLAPHEDSLDSAFRIQQEINSRTPSNE